MRAQRVLQGVRFFGRQVGHDQPVDARGVGALGKGLQAHLQDRVIVAHQEQGDVDALRRAQRAATCSRQSARLIPFSSARCEAAWIVAPSARGSLYGTPNSIRSAPPSTSAGTSV